MKHLLLSLLLLVGCSPHTCPETLDGGELWQPCPKLQDEIDNCCASGATKFACDETTTCYCDNTMYSDGICPDWGELPMSWICGEL